MFGSVDLASLLGSGDPRHLVRIESVALDSVPLDGIGIAARAVDLLTDNFLDVRLEMRDGFEAWSLQAPLVASADSAKVHGELCALALLGGAIEVPRLGCLDSNELDGYQEFFLHLAVALDAKQEQLLAATYWTLDLVGPLRMWLWDHLPQAVSSRVSKPSYLVKTWHFQDGRELLDRRSGE